MGLGGNVLDPKLIRNNPEVVKEALKNRKTEPSIVDRYLSIDETWRKLTFEIEALKAKRNEVSDRIGVLKTKGKDTKDLISEMKNLGDKIAEMEEGARGIESRLRDVALEIPNIPHSSVPVGVDERDNQEIRKWGERRDFKFSPRPHFDIGKSLGILDFESAAKVAGARFATLKGLGSLLERALINFMLDLHIKENGYIEVWAPFLVNTQSMIGTGQLPKFEEDLFKCRDDDLYLVPTAEVSITNLERDETIPFTRLPISYVSYSPCFRREAGSYGKDVKGLIRQHQFDKVELVKFTEPKASYDELEKLTLDAEKVLQRLGLHYRVVILCTGDMGFAAAKTYDIEVWFPAEGKFREISSCSNFEEFQARRANIKYKKDPEGRPEYVHTLNGSGLAIGRTFAAILEYYQEPDGSVIIPEALRPYMAGIEILRTESSGRSP